MKIHTISTNQILAIRIFDKYSQRAGNSRDAVSKRNEIIQAFNSSSFRLLVSTKRRKCLKRFSAAYKEFSNRFTILSMFSSYETIEFLANAYHYDLWRANRSINRQICLNLSEIYFGSSSKKGANAIYELDMLKRAKDEMSKGNSIDVGGYTMDAFPSEVECEYFINFSNLVGVLTDNSERISLSIPSGPSEFLDLCNRLGTEYLIDIILARYRNSEFAESVAPFMDKVERYLNKNGG